MKKKLSTLIFTVLFISCSVFTPFSKPTLVPLAKETYGKNFKIVFNRNKSYAICYSEREIKKHAPKELSFFVYDMASSSVIYKSTHINSTVDWVGINEIRIKTYSAPKLQELIINLETNETRFQTIAHQRL